ncbi:Hypothetical predicted protein, partial [Paramuricea clavata]
NTDNIFELLCSKNVVCSFVHGEYLLLDRISMDSNASHGRIHVGFVQKKLDEDDG